MKIDYELDMAMNDSDLNKINSFVEEINKLNLSNAYEVLGRVLCFFNFEVIMAYNYIWHSEGGLSITFFVNDRDGKLEKLGLIQESEKMYRSGSVHITF